MKQDELNKAIVEHDKWIRDDNNGKCANLIGANLSGTDLSDADLRDANLRDANLEFADLRNANLRNANLSGADLRNANLRYTMGNGKQIKTLLTEYYHITYTNTSMTIGCEQHTIEQWFKFTDVEIHEMDSRALEFWNKYKRVLKTLTNMET